ncbi:unnamed protein product [Rotaria sp. Silwood2]|nr:unnamed protein product [Rotaria sp. Silwood2]CAF2636111.1 unnamed protein product [Rotaria sp. Silwood2]CAF2908690.1 unnamed protein product [Rotaria sp. Silwood2]CAF3991771.1 unnamed protein product [Rotaria sp. Silwood2]CAF4315380.1 unnamed protein product [Rotaria sp. Silwood2]
MEYSYVQLNDLPDEILLIILKKFNNVELFYSLICVNKRLDKILHDFIFINTLTLMEYISYNRIYSLFDSILDRFCLPILPSFEHKIKWFHIEGLSIKHILLSGNYSNLSGLGYVYSYPFILTSYECITNNFPGALLFTYVRKVSLFDEHSFKHEFFLRIQKLFPFVDHRTVTNRKPQYKISNNGNRDLSLIHCHYLTEVYDDYIEQFILDTKTFLSLYLNLHIDY